MDMVDDELLKFWQILNKYNVAYIVAGDFAMHIQGYSGVTSSGELWIKDEAVNMQNIRKAFYELGYGDHPSLETIQYDTGYTQFYINGQIPIAIITSLKGLEDQTFDTCYKKAVKADLDGGSVPFLHINDLITNKKAVFSLKDQLDLIELEKIKKILEEKPPPNAG